MKKIFISDFVHEKCVSILSQAGFQVTFKPGVSYENLKSEIGDYDCLIVRSETKVNSELISTMNQMEIIGRAGTGIDNIDVNAASRKGIIVMNTPGGNTISAAEHTISLMLSMCRNIPQANYSLKEGKWERKKFQGTELAGKTVGIIGLGKIGREVAIRLKNFGVRIIAFDPLISSDTSLDLGVEITELDYLFANSDIITLHVPLSNETKYLISQKSLEKCKDGVKIINCARGGIVNEADLITAINSGKVSAAAIDVFEKEPPDFTNPIFNHPKIICTPHLGASTEEAQEKVAVQIAQQVRDYFHFKKMAGVVNALGLESISNAQLSPYLKLAEAIGSIYAQMIRHQLKLININFSGTFLHSSSALLTAGVLKGLLSKLLNENVNLVNAPVLAKEMKIKISETKSDESSDFINLLLVEFISDKEKKVFAGTVFGSNEFRIVKIDDYLVEVKPEGNLLFYSNIDKPGMVAAISKLLADSNINIADLSLGRIHQGKEALTVIRVDEEIDNSLQQKISLIDGISDVHFVQI